MNEQDSNTAGKRPLSIGVRSPTRPLSSGTRSGLGAGCLALFFGVFLLVGLATLTSLFVRPMLQARSARNWVLTRCTILSSEVRTHTGDNGSTYSVEIRYAYEFAGNEYESDRYNFFRISSSGYDAKASVVRRYPPGSITNCYVNPAKPAQAVLVRDIAPNRWVGLVPLVFVLVGAGGIVSAVRSKRSDRNSAAMPGPQSFGAAPPAYGMSAVTRRESGPVELRPQMSGWVKFLGITAMALFWNGIVSVFVYQVIRMWSGGEGGGGKWFMTLFLTPFVAVGLGLIGGVGYTFLAAFNPRVRLRVNTAAVALGEDLTVTWAMEGRYDRLRELVLTLEGREEATYRRGTSTTTDKSTFATILIARLNQASAMRSGQATVQVPARSMHTLLAAHNKILWCIHVKGDIPNWPDLDVEYPITVLPLSPELVSA